MLTTSILDRLCGPLCDALTRDPALPGQETLQALEHADLFLVPLDDQRRWYRYHHLFAALLRQRLKQSARSSPTEGMPGELIVPGDAAATAQNIVASESLFKFAGIGGEMVVLLSEVILSVVLYVLLKPVSKTLSLLVGVSRLAMTTIHGLNLLVYFFVLRLLSGPDFLGAFQPQQVNALVTLFLDAHSYGFIIGIAFLMPHVLILGYLIVKSGYFPRIMGILFLIAGFAYLVDTAALLFLPGYQTPGIIAAAITISEIAFPLWLLVKGVNIDGWQHRTPALEPV